MQTSARLSQKLKAVGEAPELEPFDVGIAQTPAERLAAARLVGAMYMNEGYLAQMVATAGEPPAFYALHHLLDETLVFVARDAVSGEVAGALAMVIDSPAGLPMDALYREDLDTLRAAGKKLCEFCSLAVDPKLGSRSTGLLLALFRAAYRCAYYVLGADDVCVTLKPSHAPFYRRICFLPLGELRLDARFAQAETIALRLPHETARELWASGEALQPRRRLHAFFSRPLSRGEAKALRRRVRIARRGAAEILGCLFEQPHLADCASEAQRAHLRRTLAARAGAFEAQSVPVALRLAPFSTALSDRA